jgi:hypothetical protein
MYGEMAAAIVAFYGFGLMDFRVWVAIFFRKK